MAVIGVGVDLVDARRFRPWIEKKGMIERYFGREEAEGLPSTRPEDFLASRFAAKEAFGKALKTGLSGFALKEVQLLRKANGAPELLLRGKALAALEAAGGRNVHVSVSHDAGMAAAFVVIEGD